MTRLFRLGCASAILFCGQARATLIFTTIQNVSSEFTSIGRGAANTVNGSGLDGSTPANHGTDPTTMWLNLGNGEDDGGVADPDQPGQLAHITFNLNGTWNVDSFRVWNYNEVGANTFINRGVQNLTISTALTAAGTYTPLINPGTSNTTWTFDEAPGSSSYTGQVITFSLPVTAAFIRFDISSNWGLEPVQNDQDNYVGLSEVQFDSLAVPEPATAALTCAGLLGLLALARRKQRAS
jgi:hypothetical protein